MGNILLTYDLEEKLHESKHSDVKNAMKKRGYCDSWVANDAYGQQITHYLPNTTLWKSGITPTQARNDMNDVVNECKATLERFVAVEAINWLGIPGKAYKS